MKFQPLPRSPYSSENITLIIYNLDGTNLYLRVYSLKRKKEEIYSPLTNLHTFSNNLSCSPSTTKFPLVSAT